MFLFNPLSLVMVLALKSAFASALPLAQSRHHITSSDPLQSRNLDSLSKRLPQPETGIESQLADADEEQVAVLPAGHGNDRTYVWSKWSSARNIFGAGDPQTEIQGSAL